MGICYMTQRTQTGALWQAKGWDGEGGDMVVSMADSCWWMTENHKIL